MRLDTNVEAERYFAKWQLEIGYGKHTDDSGFTTLCDYFKCPENTIHPGIKQLLFYLISTLLSALF